MTRNLSGNPVNTIKQVLTFTSFGFILGIAFLFFTNSLSLDFFTNSKLFAQAEQLNQPVYKAAPSDNNDSLIKTNLNIINSRRNAITAAIEKATPAVVSINVKSLQYRRPTSIFDYFERRKTQLVPSVGSGFVISSDGFVVTNQHVIENAHEITVILPNGDKYLAKKIGEDVQSDIALIKLQDVITELQTVEFGESDDLIIGEWAIAIGNPFGLNEINNSPTVTLGIISAINRDFGHITGEEKVYHEMIQTDASINSGNSGGPLLNAMGQVIGMNTIIYTGGSSSGSVGLAFSIPSKRIMEMVDLLKSGDIDRNVFHGIRRVSAIDASIAANYNLKVKSGMLIRTIIRNSPAHKSGLKQGDIIILANDIKINNFNDLSEAINYSDLKVGDSLSLTVVRGDETLNFSLILASASR